MWILAATVLFLLSATLYYHGRFLSSGTLGVGFWAAMTWLVWGAMGPVGASITLVFLALLPAACVAIHVVDAHRGIFLLPTVYAIPVAFIAGLLLLAVGGLALVLA